MKKFIVVKETINEEYQSGFSTEIVEANSLLEILLDFADDCGMEWEEMEWEEMKWEEEDEINTDEEAIEYVKGFNGDGCDTLISVVDLDTKKIVFKW